MRLLALSSLALLAGCRTLPHREPPEPRVDLLPAWSSPAEPGEVAAGAWWREFGVAGLDAAIEEALLANPGLAESAARVAAAAAQARIAGADRLPTLGASGSATRSKNIFVGLPVPGGNVLESHATTYGVSLDLAWEADLWGRLAARASAADERLLASAADLVAARHSLAAQTAKAWFAHAAAVRGVELAEDSVANLARALGMTQRRLDGGLGSAFEVRLAESDLAAARAGLVARRELEARTLRQLELLLGRHPSGSLADASGLPAMPPPPPAGVPGELVARRPDLAAAEARLRAADDTLYAARADLYPRLTLSASGGRTSDDPGDLVDPDFSVWRLAAGLTQPIFQGGRLRAAVDLADADVHAALAAFESALLRAVGEVELALEAERHLSVLEEERGNARRLAAEARELARERYSAGRLDVLELLASERRALDAESAELDVRLQRLATRIDLHLALGGDFDRHDTDR